VTTAQNGGKVVSTYALAAFTPMVNHYFLQDWDVQCSKGVVTLRLIISNRNVTSFFLRSLRRIESLAGGMVSEGDL